MHRNSEADGAGQVALHTFQDLSEQVARDRRVCGLAARME
jgi:hypothetical protein